MAAEAYESAVAQGRGPAEWHYRLGAVLERAKQREQAQAAFSKAISATAGGSERGAAAPFGPLVRGWLPATANERARVNIKLNGETIAWTRPTRTATFPDGTKFLTFRRRVRELQRFLGAGDVIELEHDGRQIPIIGSPDGRYVCRTGSSRSSDLIVRISSGEVFNELGFLQESRAMNEEWQRGVMNLFGKLRDELRTHLDIDLMPFYGTLLGAVREKNFISYDHDFDTAIISPFSAPQEVRDHFRQMCRHLISAGYDLRAKGAYTQVRERNGNGPKVDIFFGWFAADGMFQISWGYHGDPLQKNDEFFRFRSERLGSYDVLVPENSEAILAQLYGSTWRTPDPGWTQHTSTRVIQREYHLSEDEINELYWLQFYRDHQIADPSPFAQFTARRLSPHSKVIEIGSGSGRDSAFFAKLGHTVWGADRSPSAVERAQALLRDDNLDGSFHVVDVSSPTQVADFLADALGGEPRTQDVTIYMRFLLHSIPESAEDTLLKTVVDTLGSNFRIFAEFRTDRDRKQPKTYKNHFRRYINELELADKLATVWDFQIEHLEARTGLSPWGDEDPHLARIVVRR